MNTDELLYQITLKQIQGVGDVIAKNLVAAGLADRCEVQLAYAIGVAEPVSVLVDTFGTGKLDETRLETLVRENFQLTPSRYVGIVAAGHERTNTAGVAKLMDILNRQCDESRRLDRVIQERMALLNHG